MTITINTLAFDVKSVSDTTVNLQNFAVPAIGAPTLKVSVSDPKPVKDFVGTSKAEGKLTFRDATGAVIGIYAVTSSVRADVSETDRLAHLSTLGALVAHQSFEDAVVKVRSPING